MKSAQNMATILDIYNTVVGRYRSISTQLANWLVRLACEEILVLEAAYALEKHKDELELANYYIYVNRKIEKGTKPDLGILPKEYEYNTNNLNRYGWWFEFKLFDACENARSTFNDIIKDLERIKHCKNVFCFIGKFFFTSSLEPVRWGIS